MKKCKKCTKEFEPSKGLINFCSLECRNSRTWTEEDKKKKGKANKIIFSDEEINKIIKIFKETKTLKETAKIIGVNHTIIKKIVNFTKSTPISNYEHIKNWRKKIKQNLLNIRVENVVVVNIINV